MKILNYELDCFTVDNILNLFKVIGIFYTNPISVYKLCDEIINEFIDDRRYLDFTVLEIVSAVLLLASHVYGDYRTGCLVSSLYCKSYMNA